MMVAMDHRGLFPGLVADLPPPDGTRRAAVLVALYPDGPETRVVLTKRPMTMPTHAGHLAFPGGRADPGDDDEVATALREAHEEMGIDPSGVEVIGFLPSIHTVRFPLYVVPVVGLLGPNPVFKPSEREVDKVLLPTLRDLARPDAWRSEDWQGRRVWFYEIDGEVLWGATAMMVRQLLGLDIERTVTGPFGAGET